MREQRQVHRPIVCTLSTILLLYTGLYPLKQSVMIASNARETQRIAMENFRASTKVLHVTSWPGPPFSGGNVNRYNLLKRLCQEHRAKFVIVDSWHKVTNRTGEELHRLGIPNEGIEVVPKEHMTIADRLRGIFFSNLPPGIDFWRRKMSPRLRPVTEKLLHDWNPHVLILWMLGPASIIKNVTGVKKLLYACDSMSMLNSSIANDNLNIPRKFYHALVARRYSRWEKSCFTAYESVIFVSRRDADWVALPPSTSVSVVGNGVDTELFRPRVVPTKYYPRRLLFHGNMGYIANETCVRFLEENVGPELEKLMPEGSFEIRIVGGEFSAGLLKHLKHKAWIKITGYVDDLASELAAGDVYVAPITMGAGVKNKILEAMACGLPVIGTEEAFSGLHVRPGVDVLICPPAKVAQVAVDLLRDEETASRLGVAARRWVEKNANWDASVAQFSEIIDRLVGRNHQIDLYPHDRQEPIRERQSSFASVHFE